MFCRREGTVPLEFMTDGGIIKIKWGKTIENKWRYRHEKSTKILSL